MISTFFINRPIFANVIAIIIIILGAVCLYVLPVSQYPNIVPPTIQVTTSYPGASADIIAKTVGIPIEQAVNGVKNSIYMSSTSSSSGNYTLTVTFRWAPISTPRWPWCRTSSTGLWPSCPNRAGPRGECQAGLHQYPAGGEPLLRR